MALNRGVLLSFFLGLIFVTDVQGTFAPSRNISKISRVVVVEDHPFVFVNKTCLQQTSNYSCLSPCIYGFAVELLDKINDDLKIVDKCTYIIESTLGNVSKSAGKAVYSGALALLVNKTANVSLALFEKDKKNAGIIDLSEPFIKLGKNSTTSLSLGFPKGSSLVSAFSHMIKKLTNQRHIEQLFEVWFVESKSLWYEKRKQIQRRKPMPDYVVDRKPRHQG